MSLLSEFVIVCVCVCLSMCVCVCMLVCVCTSMLVYMLLDVCLLLIGVYICDRLLYFIVCLFVFVIFCV